MIWQSYTHTAGAAKVTVVIPVYKTEKYLRDSVQSALEQNYQNVEIILVDDGSPDACPQICDALAVPHRYNSIYSRC